jgi:signal transduction histidine kinase
VKLFPHLDGESVEVDVIDNGRGIPTGEQRRVFAPGYSTKQRGWGLGLSLAKRIIEEYHGGRIWVKASRIEKGTTMAFSVRTG